jgi:5'-nucleotidase
LSSTTPRRGFRAVIAATGFSLVAAPLVLLPSTAHAAPVDITLLNINDFHGRIDGNTVAFAATVEEERAAAGGDDNALFLSAGDNIGASLFASSSAEDNPTIDVLNALGLGASAVGNHEFDRGFDDLDGRVRERAEFDYLGANVYQAGTAVPALEEYATFEKAGVTVGVIGAVTEEVPSLVTPSGIADLDFGDPVEAVNRVAAQLSDGDDTNGEADVIVAEFHEGAVEGAPSTLEDNLARGGAFADIVNDTSAEVDAIFTGHTHMEYAYNEAPKPGGGTRPVVQTGSYGENLGKITLTVDDVTGEVTAHTAENVARKAPADTDGDGEISDAEQEAFDTEIAAIVADNPVVAEVKTIVDAALAAADEVGKQPVGEVTEDITTAYATGHFASGKWVGPGPGPADGRDDRQSESTLGNLVADALRDTLASGDRGGAQIGVVNPGGLRNELFHAGTPDPDTNADGVITFAEANAVLPFVNNLWTVTLTGAQFKQVLEEQWQPDGSSRPFLHLGLSDNVSTVLDGSKPRGERVVSVMVDGQPLEMDKQYVIATFSFLAQGGDNFSTFATAPFKDSGLVDRDAWIAYLGENRPVSPSFDRRQVFANAPARIMGSRDTSFTLEKLNLTSLGSPENTTVRATLKPAVDGGTPTDLGSFPVSGGSAAVDISLPEPVSDGQVVELVAQPSGTTVVLPTGNPVDTTTALTVRPSRSVVGSTKTKIIATVTAATPGANTADGTVDVFSGSTKLGTGQVTDGTATIVLDAFRSVGPRKLRVVYSGGYETNSSLAWTTVHVVKATPKMRIVVKPDRIRDDQTRPRVRVALRAPGRVVNGKVKVRTHGDVTTIRLKDGKAMATFSPYAKPGRKTVTVTYLGTDRVQRVKDSVTVRVLR